MNTNWLRWEHLHARNIYSKYSGSSFICPGNQYCYWFQVLFSKNTVGRTRTSKPTYPVSAIDDRRPFDSTWLLDDSKRTFVLTVEGRSQHLSRLIQLKLQTISNIWSWNYTTEEGENIQRCYKWLPFSMELWVPQMNKRWQASPLPAVTGSRYNLIGHLHTRGFGYLSFGKPFF